jgi:hypothetical protein
VFVVNFAAAEEAPRRDVYVINDDATMQGSIE